MKSKRRLSILPGAAVVLTIAMLTATGALAAPKYKVLHAFTGRKDGGGLWGGLLLDKRGNIYGTTIAGGPKENGGTVFKLSTQASGKWAEAVLYNFCSLPECADGGGPWGGLTFDPEGNLYGTTESGGGPYKYGTVFELMPGTSGWKETVLHRFGFDKYGCCPQASLAMDPAGDLFGTANAAFALSPTDHGWKETLLHDFTGENGDGFGPYAGVILDAAGNLYGTTEDGGGNHSLCSGGCGIVYQLTPGSDGKWAEVMLHRFGSFQNDGRRPGVGALIMDSSGSLYGTTTGGGAFSSRCSCGTVFKLTPSSNGKWKETVLHSFTLGAGGEGPSAGVVMDKAGNLYGTTTAGGTASCGCGVVYKLAPGSNDKWTYTVLHRFTGADGAGPNANLILDDKGNLYGTTTTGGAGGYGVAFEITP
jgi:uncharacterized repeat protein (TIGR03803 family)